MGTTKKMILVLGSSGFIGSNLVAKMQSLGHEVTGVDIERPKYGFPDIFYQIDLRYHCDEPFMDNYDEVYCLACLMGGMGFIGDEEKYGYDIGVGSTQIIINTIENVRKYCPNAKVFYSSSACVYNQNLQTDSKVVSLKEEDAYPAFPDLLYGWQKLYSEKMFLSSGLNVRIARFHNIFGELGCFDGGKEKAPGALTRKVVMAKDGGEIEVWGDGSQSRSFLYIEECLTGIEKLMDSEIREPLNIGSDELISINDLAKMVISISGKNLTIKNVKGIVGVQGRNSDNTKIEKLLGWRPSEKLFTGMSKLFYWVNKQVNI